VEKLVSQLVTHHQQKPANMDLAFRCTTMDIIASYCFARTRNSLEAEDFHDPFIVINRRAIPSIWLMKFLPLFIPIFCFLPQWFARYMPFLPILAFVDLNKMVSEQVDQILDDEDILQATGKPTIYYHLLNASKEGSRRSRRDLIEEAFSLLQAGTEGPGNVCTVGTFYVLNDPVVHKKLFEELRDAWPDKDTPIGYAALERLPYLVSRLLFS
jgi:cytochrome P450